MANLEPDNIQNDPWGKADEELVAKPSALESPKFWWFVGGLFFLGICGGGVYYYLNQVAPAPQVAINFIEPPEINPGQPFELGIAVENNSDSPLAGGRLSVALSEGLAFLDRPQNDRFADLEIEPLAAGATHPEKFMLLATGEAEGGIRQVRAAYQYRGTTNDKVQFEKKSELDLTLSQPIASLSIEAPEKILSGEKFNVRFICRNNTRQTLSGLALKVGYPAGYEFSTSTLPVARNENEWDIPPLPPGALAEIVLEGSAIGPSNSFYGFSGELSQNLGGRVFVLQKISANSTIEDSPLSLKIVANKSQDYIARPGDTLDYELTYRNNANVTLSEVVLTAGLTGKLFKFDKAIAKANFDSVQNVFIWNSQNTPSLAHLAPGAEGKINLSIPLLTEYPVSETSGGGHELKILGRIESPTLPPRTAATKTVAVASLTTKIGGALSIKTQGFWRDAPSKVLNSGPFPPRVNTPTQFTIHWVLQATGSDFENIRVSAPLSPGARWTQLAKSSGGSVPALEPGSNIISWQVDKLMAGDRAEGIFQVEITPAANQISRFVPLIGQTKMAAKDSFTGQEASGATDAVESNVPADLTISGVRWVVP